MGAGLCSFPEFIETFWSMQTDLRCPIADLRHVFFLPPAVQLQRRVWMAAFVIAGVRRFDLDSGNYIA
jgi:hypothetical protein